MNPAQPQILVLFVCTGNYYRSRIAEIIFNHYAEQKPLQAKAFSRGLRLNPVKNTQSISPHALPFLSGLNISGFDIGNSRQLEHADLEKATHIIAMSEKEHQPMMVEKFPEWAHKVDYWTMEDDYLVDPLIVLPELRLKVEALLDCLSEKHRP